jgi:hypothetical protein
MGHVVLGIDQRLPVYSNKQTISEPVRASRLGQSTKSLRSSPLRGARAERPVADREDSGVKVSTINKRCVGVQHMIARGSCPHTAGRIIGRIDNTMTKIALTKARTSFLEYAVSIRLARN